MGKDFTKKDKMDRSFSEEIDIDPHNLLLEAATNGGKYIYWGLKCAEASFNREDAKKRLEEVKAEEDIEIRRENVGTKITEASISALILTNPFYKKAYNIYLNAKKVADEMAIVKDSFFQRKDLIVSMRRDQVREFLHNEDAIVSDVEKVMEEQEKYEGNSKDV